jgi:electron transfer flavoprotein beta subunit
MKILVPVKQVASIGGDVKLDGAGELDPRALHWQANEWDAFSLEAALQLAESSSAGEGFEVVVVTVADEQAEVGLRACLAMGADRGIRVWDPSLERLEDPLAIAAVLAAVARREAPELILCGVQSSDSANAATGVALAGLLELPRVAVVTAIEQDGGELTVQRELDGGAVEVLRLSLPALLTIQTGINEPRRANLRAIKLARSKPSATLALSDLDLDVSDVREVAGARTVRLLERERGEGASMIEGPAEAIAGRIVEIVTRELRA